MLASLEWLKQYVDINISVAELCDKITRVGLEVDTVTQLGKGLEGVITGKVMEIHRHPDSDHLWVCMLDYGQGGEPVQILTGAQNVHQYGACCRSWQRTASERAQSARPEAEKG